MKKESEIKVETSQESQHEEPAMETSTINTVSSSSSSTEKRRKHRKVLKSKQYLDEDGFMGKSNM